MPRLFVVLLMLVGLTRIAPAAAIFYSDSGLFNAAVVAAGLSTRVIDFESVAPGEYATSSGLSIDGLTFVGPYPPLSFQLWVFDEEIWGRHFAPDTGNTLASVNRIDIALPAGTRAFGANVGQSVVWALGVDSRFELRLSTGESASTGTSPSRLFPFFGFVSDIPVASVSIGFSSSIITIDNVTTGAMDNVRSEAVATPEPATLLVSAGAIVLLIAFRRLCGAQPVR